MKHSYYLFLVSAAAMAGALAGCAGRAASEQPSVRTAMVSIEPLRPIAEAVAGPGWEVATLLGAGADPETFDPTVGMLRRAAQADVLFTTDFLPFEQALVERLGADSAKVAAVGAAPQAIEVIEGTHGDEHGADPHIWASLRNAQRIAANIADRLAAADPAGAEGYRHRADSLGAIYAAADSAIASQLSSAELRAFMVRHPSLSYFARDYGLQQIAIGADNKDLSVSAIREALDEARGRAAIFFVESAADSSRAASVASTLRIPVEVFAPLSPDIVGNLNRVAASIAAQKQQP